MDRSDPRLSYRPLLPLVDGQRLGREGLLYAALKTYQAVFYRIFLVFFEFRFCVKDRVEDCGAGLLNSYRCCVLKQPRLQPLVKEKLLVLLNLMHRNQAGTSKDWINSLLILGSKKGGKGIRPIAVDNVFMRIMGKCLNLQLARKVGNKLEPLQLAVGASAGCERAAHNLLVWINCHGGFRKQQRQQMCD
jgi:hypothetical protein